MTEEANLGKTIDTPLVVKIKKTVLLWDIYILTLYRANLISLKF